MVTRSEIIKEILQLQNINRRLDNIGITLAVLQMKTNH